MTSGDCFGEGQQAASGRYSAVQDWMWARYRTDPYDLRVEVARRWPELLPALDGLPCSPAHPWLMRACPGAFR